MVAKRVIAAIVAAKKIPLEEITLESSLADLGLDSLDALNMAYELELEFDGRLSKDDFEGIRTVGQLVALIERGRLGTESH
jgi:acyl carrier protein